MKRLGGTAQWREPRPWRRRGWSVERIHAITAIDPWFLWKLKRINNMYSYLREFSDYQQCAYGETNLLNACVRDPKLS